MLASDAVWYNDVRALPRRPNEFFPTRDQSPEERVNAIVRLLVYCTAAVVAYKRQWKYALFGAGAVAVVSLAYRGTGRRQRRWSPPDANVDMSKAQHTPPAASRAAAVGGVVPRDAQRARPRCTASTPDNPFGNMLLSDLNDRPDRAPACKYDDQAELIRQNFNRGLVRNAYDVYEKENSQRQWMTMPVTASAPDTVAFAHFCYGNAGRTTCKEDPSKCTGAFP